MIKNKFIIIVGLCLILPMSAFPLKDPHNTIEIQTPTIYPDTEKNQYLISDLIEKASVLTTRIYSKYIKILESSPDSSNTAYSLAVNYVSDPDQSVLQLSMKNNKSEEITSYNIMGGIKNDTPLYLARAIFYLWAGHNNFLTDSARKGPIYIDDLSTEYIQESVIPETPTMLMPMDLAVKSNGNLLGAFSMICVEFDSNFRILEQPGRSLYERGSYTSAAGVAVTPGGTVYLKPSMGRDIYRFAEGTTVAEKWRTGIDIYGPFISLPDGSILVVDVQKKKALKIYNRKKTELPLFTSPYSYIAAVAAGPEGNIWVYDLAEQRIRIHTSEGEILDSIIPVIDTSSGISPSSLSVYKDGRFVLYYSGGKMCSFTREGIPIWEISKIKTLEDTESLPQTAKIAVDNKNGLIYIADLMGQRIIKLQDRSFSSDHQIIDKNTNLLTGLNKKFFNTGSISSIAAKAEFYENVNALELANQTWEKILDIDSEYEPAYHRLDQIKVKIMTLNAETMKNKTIIKLQGLGTESARNDYRKTIQLYEKILALEPSNREIMDNKASLEELFTQGGRRGKEKPPFKIDTLTVENLFPSLMQFYQNTPVGKINLQNTGSSEIEDLQVSLFIKQFMDFPVVSKMVDTINPSEKVDIDLNLIFNQQVLKLEEDLQVQVKIELSFNYKGEKNSSEETRVVTLYRRTAMQWDDSGKLSSFITPHENIVEQFSHKVISISDMDYGIKFTEKFSQAIRITNALGAYGITYIEDPSSPITKILGNKEVVDTVRFPRKTLFIRSGDCDDTTALLSSLFESAGINTAILTSPGHVFMAFDSEEPVSNRWMYESELVNSIPYKGTLWIPIETTYLEDGFFKSWEAASRTMKTYKEKGKIEFLTIKDQRDKYPPLPLGESIYQVLEPTAEKIAVFDNKTIQELRTDFYKNLIGKLNNDAESASARRKSAIQNRLGILHVRFENYSEAEKVFKKINREQPEYISAYVNLANLYRIQKQTDSAIGRLKSALQKAPDSTTVNLVLAQCYYDKSEFSKAGALFEDIYSKSPEFARNYLYLASSKEGKNNTSRASNTGKKQPIFWDSEE